MLWLLSDGLFGDLQTAAGSADSVSHTCCHEKLYKYWVCRAVQGPEGQGMRMRRARMREMQ